MSSYFNEEYYLSAKVKQLSSQPGGKQWTVEEVKAEFAKQGFSAEEHYNMFGRAENLNPNAYFNEMEYLAGKLACLQEDAETSAEWAGKSVADLQAEFARIGITPAEHYETWGAFETRADGTLLNPSNAFDANAYFAAKLAQLQASGFEGADSLTVADVVKVFQETGLTPVSHFQLHGADESKTDGVSMAQTVPVTQRMPNDPNRAVLGEIVPGNYNPASAGPAAAVAAPVTKPADMGGLSAAAPAAPANPLLVPGDTGYVAPPPTIKDTNEAPVLPPSTDKGTGPNASFIVVDKTTGKGTVVKPDGTIQGTIDNVEVKPDGTITPPKPDAPILDGSGNNTNDHPADDSGDPITPPNPGGGGGGGGPAPVLQVTYDDDANPTTATIKFLNADSTVTLATNAEGKLVLTPASGTPHTLKDGFDPFRPTPPDPTVPDPTPYDTLKIDSSVTLKGASDILKNKNVEAFWPDNFGNVVITAFKLGDDFRFLDKVLNVTAVVEDSMVLAINDNHANIDVLSVNAGKTLTVTEVIGLSGRKLVGAGNVVLQSTAPVQADLSVDASGITASGSVTATFNADGTGEAKTLTYEGSAGVDSVTLNRADGGGDYSKLKADIDLGAGNDMLTITTGDTAFAVGSTINGGSGTDTFALKGALAGDLTVDFTTLTLTSVEKLDMSNVTGDFGLTLTGFGDKDTNFAVTGAADGPTTMEMGEKNDTLTLTGSRSFGIDSGKGADRVTLTAASGSDTIILDKADFYTGSAGSFAATNLDTITGFTTGVGGDKLKVSSLITGGALETEIDAKPASATQIADNKVYVIKDSNFDGTAVASAAAMSTYLFGNGTVGGYFTNTASTADAQAVVIVRGQTASYVVYIDSGTDAAIASTELAYVATLTGVTATTLTGFDSANFDFSASLD